MLIKNTKRVVIAIVGTIVTVIGILMLVGPGPGLIVFPAGLAILGTEFPWAQRLFKRLKARAVSAWHSIHTSAHPPSGDCVSSATDSEPRV